MSWNEVEVREQRQRFVAEAVCGKDSVAALCREFDICRSTGYKWLKRLREEGLAGLEERSRRPRTSPRKTPEAVEQRVVALRRQRPDWGAKKLRVLLAAEGFELPAVTIHRILLRHDLVANEDRHRPALERFERARPNELWQMDFKGVPAAWQSSGLTPLSILDDHSRYLLALEAQTKTTAQAVRTTLEEVFTTNGLPEQMLMDHGAPWWNMQGAGWTKLTVWLMQQGVELRFSGYRHPQTQGKVERLHGSLHRALQRRGRPRQSYQWQAWLDDFRQEYNRLRPHEALDMQPPASRWRPSRRRFDPTPRRWEYPADAWVKRIGVNGGLWLDQRRWEVSCALSGQWVALERVGERLLVRYCRTIVREIDLAKGRSLPVAFRFTDCRWPTATEAPDSELNSG